MSTSYSEEEQHFEEREGTVNGTRQLQLYLRNYL